MAGKGERQVGNKTLRGNASQFFVAGELCRQGLVAVVTMGNCPNTDVLVSNVDGTKFAHVQVKTFVPGNRTCSAGSKAEIDYGPNFFWVLGGIPLPGTGSAFEYYVIPARDMAREIRKAHQLWLDTPGKNGQPHSEENRIRAIHLPPRVSPCGWDLAKYRDRWDLIVEMLV
jgi:hypothetical protein